MSFTLENLINTNICTFSAVTDLNTISFVFIGSIHKEKHIVSIAPLNFETPQMVLKGLNLYNAKRLAIVTKLQDDFYLKVHSDLIQDLPENDFVLVCKQQVFRSFFNKKNTFELNTESYSRLDSPVRCWMSDAYHHLHPNT